VAFDRDSYQGSEAAMKYFVLGAIGSGMLLYGISMIYGATGSIEFSTISQVIAQKGASDKVLVFGLVFVLIGIAFKFGAVPFHMWLPDVYEGAPTSVVLLLASASKIAAFALAMRLLVGGLGHLHADWQAMLVVLSVLSIALGNVIAVAQTNVKRMLAYSTISHVGFIFLGILAGTHQGYSAAMFYTLIYAMMAAGAFGILILLGREGFEVEKLQDLAGLNDRSPWYAAMMGLLMFSMAGVPPTVGFMAKLLVLEAVIRVDLLWIALVAVAFSIVGAFYYIRVVKLMYFDKPLDTAPLVASTGTRVAVSINGLAMLVLGVFPASLLAYCQTVFSGG
jgi:NADH-quinone oxidoreductase subunit N